MYKKAVNVIDVNSCINVNVTNGHLILSGKNWCLSGLISKYGYEIFLKHNSK